MNERIKAFRQYKKMSTRDFAAELGMTCGAISLIETGKRNPTSQFLSALCSKFPELNRYWLESGEGDMIVKSTEAQIAEASVSILHGEVSEEMLDLFEVLKAMNKEEQELLLQIAKKMAKDNGVE